MMRRTIAFSASVLLGLTITACQPTPECDQACADNVNAAIVRQVEADRAAPVRPVPCLCAASRVGSWTLAAHSGLSQAQNPISSASGAYQFLDSTWRNASAAAGLTGWGRAKEAPWWVQDRVAYHLAIELGERGHWAGTGCAGHDLRRNVLLFAD